MVLKSISFRRSGILLLWDEFSFWELGVLGERGSWDGISIGEVGEERGELSLLVVAIYLKRLVFS